MSSPELELSRKLDKEKNNLIKLSRKQQKIVEIGIQVAQRSFLKHKHSALIIKNGKILIAESNSKRTRICGENCVSTHAEIAALARYSRNYKMNSKRKNMVLNGPPLVNLKSINKIDIWLIRYDLVKLQISNSKPCYSCLQALKDAGVRRVFYSNKKGEIKCKKPSELQGYTTWTQQLQQVKIPTHWNF